VFCVAAIKTADTAAQKFALDTLVRLQSEINTRLYDPNVQIEQFRADCHAIFAQALAVTPAIIGVVPGLSPGCFLD
jgi:hypothetical protein